MHRQASSVKRAFSTATNVLKDPFPLGKLDRVIVYGRPTSRVQKVTFLLEEMQVPYERVDLPSPPPEYLKEINPLGLVPAIRDGATILDGSNAICAYLSHKHCRSRGFYPTDSLSLGRAVKWGEFIEYHLASPRLNVVFHAAINNMYPPSFQRPGCPNEEELQGHVAATAAALEVLNAHLASSRAELGNGSFLANTNTFTFADAIAAPWLHKWYVHASEGTFGPSLAPERFEAVLSYYQQLAARPAFQKEIVNHRT